MAELLFNTYGFTKRERTVAINIEDDNMRDMIILFYYIFRRRSCIKRMDNFDNLIIPLITGKTPEMDHMYETILRKLSQKRADHDLFRDFCQINEHVIKKIQFEYRNRGITYNIPLTNAMVGGYYDQYLYFKRLYKILKNKQ